MMVSLLQPRRQASADRDPISNLQIIEELCGIVQLQAKIIRAQSEALEQLGAVTMEEEIAEAAELAGRLCHDDG